MIATVPRSRLRLLKWTVRRKGTVRGFADIQLPNRLRIFGCVVHVSRDGKAWAGFPGRPQIDRDGRHIEVDGKKQYTKFLEWEGSELANEFSAALVELIRAQDPAAFAPEETEPARPA
jgi:hypothetical protein